MYMVFGNDERMNEARKLLSVEKTQDVVCVFQPNVKVIKEDTKRIPSACGNHSKALLSSFRKTDHPSSIMRSIQARDARNVSSGSTISSPARPFTARYTSGSVVIFML